jgi:acyl carrier protein
MNNTKKLKNSFSEALNISIELITENLEYQSISEWDSITHMILISQLEEDFDVSIDTDDVVNLNSVAAARQILSKLGVVF